MAMNRAYLNVFSCRSFKRFDPHFRAGLFVLSLLLHFLPSSSWAQDQDPGGTLVRVTGTHVIWLEPENTTDDDSPGVYALWPGEIFRASNQASGGYRIVDGYKAVADAELDSALFLQESTAHFKALPANGMEGRLDLEAGQVTTITFWPAETAEECTSSNAPCKVISANQRLRIIDSRMVRRQIYPEIFEWQNFYKVRLQNGDEGWIESFAVLTNHAMARSRVEVRGAHSQYAPSQPHLRESPGTPNSEIEKFATQLSPHMGQCLLSSPSTPPRASSSADAFDTFVGRYWKEHGNLEVEGPDGRITTPQFEAIDGLARTIYGEMARCRRHGEHYLAAVAAVAQNRVHYIEEHPDVRHIFAEENASTKRMDMTDVIASPEQFSVWNWHGSSQVRIRVPDTQGSGWHYRYRMALGPNKSLPQVLCPPARENEIFFEDRPAISSEVEIWDTSLRIAVEAVLFPKQFAERSASVHAYYYTSGLPRFRRGFREVSESMDGYPLDNPACIQLWENPKGVGIE